MIHCQSTSDKSEIVSICSFSLLFACFSKALAWHCSQRNMTKCSQSKFDRKRTLATDASATPVQCCSLHICSQCQWVLLVQNSPISTKCTMGHLPSEKPLKFEFCIDRQLPNFCGKKCCLEAKQSNRKTSAHRVVHGRVGVGFKDGHPSFEGHAEEQEFCSRQFGVSSPSLSRMCDLSHASRLDDHHFEIFFRSDLSKTPITPCFTTESDQGFS